MDYTHVPAGQTMKEIFWHQATKQMDKNYCKAKWSFNCIWINKAFLYQDGSSVDI